MAWQLDHAKAEDWLPQQADASADLILVDPPYFRVKDEPWDRQWDTAAGFLAWLDGLAAEWRRILRPNGSLYVFASPHMSTRVETLLQERFNVLNNIRWYKEAGWHQKAKKDELRSFLSPWEAVIFAEQRGDLYGEMEKALHKEVYAPLGRYIQLERERAGFTRSQVEVALGFVSRTDPTRGTALCYRWEEGACLPTEEVYNRLRDVLNQSGDYEYLRRDYEELRRDYEELRRDYEELRRPFALSDGTSWADRWDFPAVQPYPGKHPCEKPLPLLRHIIAASTRPGALVLDCFAGSGNTGIAARQLGRDFIGCDASPVWVVRGARRIADAALQAELPLGAA
jgi:adenine-specific DNA-methyltransferase